MTDVTQQTQVGETINARGSYQFLRAGRLGEQIVSLLNGGFYENATNNRSFSGMLLATTTGVAAGNVTGAAAAASTQFALWNPVGSQINIAIMKVFVGLISGTPVGGPMFHNTFLTVPSIAGVSGANNYIGQSGSIGRLQSSAGGSALTGGGALTQLRPMEFDFSAGAFAAVSGQSVVAEQVEGDIVLPPGTGWVPCWQAAGTTVLNSYGVVWNEIPV